MRYAGRFSNEYGALECDTKNKERADQKDLSGIVPEADNYAYRSYVSHPLRDPVLRSVIRALHLPSGSSGLDAGCGIGLPTLLLAEAVGSGVHVIGLDLSSNSWAMQRRSQSGGGDVCEMLFDDDTFDWVWSADFVGYVPMEPVPLLRELARIVKPGGIVVILAWSSQQLFPGYPLLEARLNATSAGIAPFTKGMIPKRNFLRILDWFCEVGLEGPAVRIIVGGVQAPLSEEVRKALMSFFQMRGDGVRSEISEEDRMEYQRLCQPGSPDHYAFFTCTMYWQDPGMNSGSVWIG